MTFRVLRASSSKPTRCPYRVVEKTTEREIDWIHRYLDYETLRRLADHTLQSYANELLYFLRWWESVHHTDTISKDKLTESTLLDYSAIPACALVNVSISPMIASGMSAPSAGPFTFLWAN